MNRMSHWMIAAAAALAVPACGGKKEEPKPVAGSADPAGSAAPAGSGSDSGSAAAAGSGSGSGSAVAADSGSGSAAADPDVPTEVDFEAEAKAKITEKNLEQQVKAVEQELGR